jgi:hypothetical protein
MPGFFLALGLMLALSTAQAQGNPPPAAGRETAGAIEQQLTSVRSQITGIEAAGRQSHAYQVFAIWLEGQTALGKQAYDPAHLPAMPALEAASAKAKAELEAAKSYRDGLRTDFTARLSNTPFDQRAVAKANLEAILNAESTQINVAEQLAGDFDKIAEALRTRTKPDALMLARVQMNAQAKAMYDKAIADIEAASENLKTPPPS